MRIHLDHAATSPLRPEVAEVIAEVGARSLGNPSSLHASGRRARRLLDDARDEVAALVGARPKEIVFTSGGTEADDLAVNGVAAARAGAVLCSSIEHEAVLRAVAALGERGRVVAVSERGRLRMDDLERNLRAAADTGGVSLVSVLSVNNENGVRQDLDAIASVIARVVPGTPLHTDAVQALGWLDLSRTAGAAELISLSAHKIGGPVGVGALVVREGVALEPRLRGGGQEHERRSGTQNVVGAVAFACALRHCARERATEATRVAALRDRLADGILATCAPVIEPAVGASRDRTALVGGVTQFCFDGLESEALLFLLDEAGVEASAGSACAAGALEISHVLTAMGVAPELARGALRVSVGRQTTEADVEAAIGVIAHAVTRLRSVRAA